MQRQIGYKGVAEDDNSIIAMSLRLAEIFAKTGEHEKAELGFEFCIDSMEKKIQSGNIKFLEDLARKKICCLRFLCVTKVDWKVSTVFRDKR